MVAEQLSRLLSLYEEYSLCPDDADYIRADAFEKCPGLTELWTQPFMAKYETKGGPVLIRVRTNHNGNTEYSVDILGK